MGEERDPERTQALELVAAFVCAHELLRAFVCVCVRTHVCARMCVFTMGVIVWVRLKLRVCVHILNLCELYICICQPITMQA